MATLLKMQKPMPRLGRGVMSGRTYQAKGILRLAAEHGLDAHAGGAAGVARRFERIVADPRVARAESDVSLLHFPPHQSQVRIPVTQANLVLGGGTGLELRQTRKRTRSCRSHPTQPGTAPGTRAGVRRGGHGIGKSYRAPERWEQRPAKCLSTPPSGAERTAEHDRGSTAGRECFQKLTSRGAGPLHNAARGGLAIHSKSPRGNTKSPDQTAIVALTSTASTKAGRLVGELRSISPFPGVILQSCVIQRNPPPPRCGGPPHEERKKACRTLD